MLNLDTRVLLHALGGELTAAESRLLSSMSTTGRFTGRWRGFISGPLASICAAIGSLDFRGDPADELIAATSVIHGVPLVTRDARIRRSRRVPLAR